LVRKNYYYVLMPPLNVTSAELHRIVDALEPSLDDLMRS
jgi:adenosylmethionine-8-amino-7-oxononanoate aminotransferase